MNARTTLYWICTPLLALLLVVGARGSDEPTLRFSVGDQPVATLGLSQLRFRLAEHEIALLDPHYRKQKHFRAFALTDVLDMGFDDRWRSDDVPEIVLIALDGYCGDRLACDRYRRRQHQ